ncbi:hypothetical protein [Pseudomonas sp. EMN2]|uniref:hypothetical protein n=1 Tax=Pseudomonas sp. EMN2 TaxID=2615212 RepID=UPI00129B819B|nr:hypothetical protein [Pseudomonas sp. EMN2]
MGLLLKSTKAVGTGIPILKAGFIEPKQEIERQGNLSQLWPVATMELRGLPRAAIQGAQGVSRFVSFEVSNHRQYVISIDHIIALYPLAQERTFAKGGIVLINGLGKEGKHVALELSGPEIRKLHKALLLE